MSGTSFAAQQRYKALKEHLQGRTNLSFTAVTDQRHVVGSVDHDEVFAEHREKRPSVRTYEETPEEVKEEERRQKIHRAAVKRASRLHYIRGVEKNYVVSFVKDVDSVMNYVVVNSRSDA